jgi:hypothetical protein
VDSVFEPPPAARRQLLRFSLVAGNGSENGRRIAAFLRPEPGPQEIRGSGSRSSQNEKSGGESHPSRGRGDWDQRPGVSKRAVRERKVDDRATSESEIGTIERDTIKTVELRMKGSDQGSDGKGFPSAR